MLKRAVSRGHFNLNLIFPDWEIVRDILPFAGGAYNGVQLDTNSFHSSEDFTPDLIPGNRLLALEPPPLAFQVMLIYLHR